MKTRNLFFYLLILASVLLTIGCDFSSSDNGKGGGGTIVPTKTVIFENAEQTGGIPGTTDSTGLILTFSGDPTTLAESDITITGASKGALSGDGTTRALVISDITVGNGEQISISVTDPSGYTISGSPQTAVVYKDITVPPTAITFENAVQTGGIPGAIDSTGLILTFSGDPTTLAESDITITGATKGALSGDGTTRALVISDITVGNGEQISISVTDPSGYTISGSPQTAVVYKDIMPDVSYRELVFITGDTYFQSTLGSSGFMHTVSSFSLGKYEVTYELWYTVHQWAIANGYTFSNLGREGSRGINGNIPTETGKYRPVTLINWRDAIVWCNAYSEMSGLDPCYSYSSTIIKDSQDSNATACDNAICDWDANGYRLPSEGEWQFAASNKGATPSNYASGAAADYTDETETGKVAWYNGNSIYPQSVGTTANSNSLSLWDMSGNVNEWCWDWWYMRYPNVAQTDYRGPEGPVTDRILRGGSFVRDTSYLRVGYRAYNKPYSEVDGSGNFSNSFRVARSY